MSDINDADREAVSRLIEVIRDAKAEGTDIKDCHEIWRSAFAAHRIAERERIVRVVSEFSLGIPDPYDVSAAWALENVVRKIKQPTTKGHGDE